MKNSSCVHRPKVVDTLYCSTPLENKFFKWNEYICGGITWVYINGSWYSTYRGLKFRINDYHDTLYLRVRFKDIPEDIGIQKFMINRYSKTKVIQSQDIEEPTEFLLTRFSEVYKKLISPEYKESSEIQKAVKYLRRYYSEDME